MKTLFTLLALTTLLFALTLPTVAQTYTYSNLYSFQNNGSDPTRPSALIIDGSGNLYGAALAGGLYNNGVVYSVSPSGTLNLLYSFNGNDSNDAVSPINLLRDSKGNLYGDTEYVARSWVGELFQLTPNGNGTYTFTSLYDASDAPAQIVLNPEGDIFWLNCGYNGDPSCSHNTSLNELANGQNAVEYDFTSIGFYSSGNFIIDKAGDVYGTEAGGGPSNNGLVYRWSPVSGYSVVHAFRGADGSNPDALQQDSAGNIYGVTSSGGANNSGTVFKITPTGGFSTLYTFCSKPACADGKYPIGPIVLDRSGNIYGVMPSGVFALTSTGSETVIYRNHSLFMGPGLVMDKSGNLYGTTSNGGPSGLGSVYKLTKQ